MTVLDELGYSASQHFVAAAKANDLPPSELTFGLRSAIEACSEIIGAKSGLGFQGAYVLQEEPQSPAIPVVYVVRIDSDSVAKRIHKFVWNQNLVPFLIVESRTTVRLYAGFAFDRDTDRSLSEVAANTAAILESLSAFRADAIDDGTIWTEWAHAVDPAKRVDEALLRDLRLLDNKLQKQEGIGRTASHGLIGKYVYLRYLRDRDILSDKKLSKWKLDSNQVFGRQATKSAFAQLDQELQAWLNGSVFSFGEESLRQITQSQLRLVASVFRGDSPDGQLNLFDPYDFSHIPIETLSCVYEQFLHDAKTADGASRGKTLGAYYTPIPLTDYVISEMDRKQPLKPGMRVLDPACGSGAFLVQCYRRLIERRRRAERRELKASELRELLTNHVFGIDRDDDACRVAELSLILTLLDYVDPPDLENTTFKLPYLRGRNIFQGDFFTPDGPVHDFIEQERFDWVIGNPPWATIRRTPPPEHEHAIAYQWMQQHNEQTPTTGNQIAEAFLWKASEHLTIKGVAAMVVPAMTWFKKEGKRFRQAFFSLNTAWCVANFANLAEVLFAGRSRRPASVIFFEVGQPEEDHVILAFTPMAAEQVANRAPSRRRIATWSIVVSGTELKEIDSSVAALGDSLSWKLAMWGTSRDRKLLLRIERRFGRFDSLRPLGVSEPREGVQLRTAPIDQGEIVEPHPELAGEKKLIIEKLRRIGRIFAFPQDAIGEIQSEECYIRKRGGLSGLAVSEPPHIVVDASRRFAVYSDKFLLVPPRQVGITGDKKSAVLLRALSLYLNSDFVRYHQFFLSPKWGVDENLADLETLKQLPTPLALLSQKQLAQWAELQQELFVASQRQHNPSLSRNTSRSPISMFAELNDLVYSALALGEADRWLVEDFVLTNMELRQGKTPTAVMRNPTDPEIDLYLKALRNSLDGFLSKERGFRHQIRALIEAGSALLSISLTRQSKPITPILVAANDAATRSLRTIRGQLTTRQSQWIYFDRALKVYERGVLYQFKPMQRLHWTRRQAVIDADEIIAETLAEGGGG